MIELDLHSYAKKSVTTSLYLSLCLLLMKQGTYTLNSHPINFGPSDFGPNATFLEFRIYFYYLVFFLINCILDIFHLKTIFLNASLYFIGGAKSF